MYLIKIGSSGNELNVETARLVTSASRYPDNSTWQTLGGLYKPG